MRVPTHTPTCQCRMQQDPLSSKEATHHTPHWSACSVRLRSPLVHGTERSLRGRAWVGRCCRVGARPLRTTRRKTILPGVFEESLTPHVFAWWSQPHLRREISKCWVVPGTQKSLILCLPKRPHGCLVRKGNHSVQ